MSTADRDYTKDLYSLLGIGRHVSTAELRYAYEQAMTAATRSGDMVRAQVLLGAFEALSAPRQEKVFGRSFDSSAPTHSSTAQSQRRGLPRPRATPGSQTRPRRASREPRPKKWGMSLPIRILLFGVIVPLTLLSMLAPVLKVAQDGSDGAIQQPQGGAAVFGASPPPAVTPAQAALYLDQVNARADITCAASNTATTNTATTSTVSKGTAGSAGRAAQFICQGSDGHTWQVTGATVADLSAVTTTPSVYLESAQFDARSTVAALATCRTRFSGGLPQSVEGQTVHVSFACGDGTLTLYLRPGDTLQYTRSRATTYQLTITASDGETVSYDSTTRRYSS